MLGVSPKNNMATIALLAAPGKLLGFLLLAGNGSLSEGPSQRDCIFTGVPSAVALLDHELGSFIQKNKNTEFQCRIIHDGESFKVTVPVSRNTTVLLQVPSFGFGSWHVQQGNAESTKGVCELAKG